ncbi:MAG: hypothetical protein GY759_22575 [Chloroflexi bacterium]|nr:hypothetical protein [Chloroflexota bacterium]
MPEVFRWWRQRRRTVSKAQESRSRRQNWLSGLYKLLSPVITLVLLNFAILLFAQLGYPNGLLQNLTIVILTWLIYRVLQMLLYTDNGHKGTLSKVWNLRVNKLASSCLYIPSV